MEKVDVKFGEWLERGFTLYKEQIGVLILPSILVMVISALSLGILAGPMAAGLILITLRLKDKTEPKPEAGDVFKGFDFFVNALIFAIAFFVVAFVGSTILGVVPVIGGLMGAFFAYSLAALLMFALFLIVDKKMDFWPACQASIDKVKTNFWPFLGFAVVASVISSLGVIACGIGVVVTMPFYFCAVAVAYRDVFGDEAAVAYVEPKTDEQKQDDQSGGSVPPPMPPA